MGPANRKMISIAAPDKHATLSKAQKSFNRLIEQIDQRRTQMAAWEAMLRRYQKKYSEELLPLERNLDEMRIRMVRQLSTSRDRKGLTRKERKQIDDFVVDMIQSMFGATGAPIDADLKAIYNLHSRSDFDDDIAQGKEFVKGMMTAITGVEFDETMDFDSPNELMEHAARKLAEGESDDELEPAWAERPSRRKKSAKQIAREEARAEEEKNVSDSLREVYRKLASTLHPDGEPDLVERERKNDLMQQANKAYESGNLLRLLELQLELEHIDASALARMSEQKLIRYNVILKEQVQELDTALLFLRQDFMMRFQLESFPTTSPATALRKLDREVVMATHAVRNIEHDLIAIADLNALKETLIKYAHRET